MTAEGEGVKGQGGMSTTVTVEQQHGGEVEATPLPFKQMAALALALLSESICATMLLPFVGLLVAHLQGSDNANQSGRITGFMIGSFMFGQVVSSKLWGLLSDTYGRRIPMLVGLFVSGWAMLFFGLSPNVYVCCLLRLIHGFLNGNVLVAKTMISDITDETNEAKGFALVSITWGTGSLFGPAIGGFLYSPADNPKLQWMHVKPNSFLGHYPAFLPSLVIFLYSMVSLVICAMVLKETNPHRKPISSAKPVQFLARHVPCLRHLRRDRAATTEVIVTDAAAAPLSGGPGWCKSVKMSAVTGDGVKPFSLHAAQQSTIAVVHGKSDPTPLLDSEMGEAAPVDARNTTTAKAPLRLTKISYAQALSIEPIRNITIFYVLLAASDMAYAEILPLWGVATRDVGGLGFFSDTVATIMLVCSIPSVVANVGFHKMCELLNSNYIRFWMLSMAMYTTSVLLVPCGNAMGRTTGLVYIIGVAMLRQVGVSWGYSLIHMLTAKAAPQGCVGAVYGISQSFASTTRCIVPILIMPLFAWSIDHLRPFPLNYYLVFLLSAACTLAGFVLSFYMRVTRNTEDDLHDEELARQEAAKRHARTGMPRDLASDCAADARATASSAVVYVDRGAASSGCDCEVNDEDDHAGVESMQGAYFSLVASFCTNPIGDAYVPVVELKRMRRESGAASPASAAGRGVATRDNEEENDPQSPVALKEREVVDSSPAGTRHTAAIRATTPRLLQSLRGQQVESRRLAALSPAGGANELVDDGELPDLSTAHP